MATHLVMPKLGLTMTEGTITEWLVKEGDQISKGQSLFVVETDKISKDFESTADGTLLKILVPEGTVDVKVPVAIVGEEGEDISALLGDEGTAAPAEQEEEKKEETESPKKEEAQAKPQGKVKISPRAKKLAKELGVDYTAVTGTAKGGSISEEDIQAYADQKGGGEESKEESKDEKVKATPMAQIEAEKQGVDLKDIVSEGRVYREDVQRAAQVQGKSEGKEERIKMSKMRHIISDRMQQSDNETARVAFNITCDMTEIAKMRDSLKETKKVSYNDILMYIVARTLRKHPMLNASQDGEEIVLHPHVHMGMAVAVKDGLMVPVISEACCKTLTEIADEAKDLAGQCNSGGINPDLLSGSTFTMTNLGMYGIESFTPIINQPNVAILGVNAIKKQPVVVDDEICIRPMMTLSLTADHRIIDGSVAAEFLRDLKADIELPSRLFL